MKHFSGCVLFALCASVCELALGQTAFPSKPIRLIAPSSAGGPVDVIARIVAHGWSEVLGEQIVVDNRAGAAGMIGAELVARAAPDGYTLLLGFSGPLVIVPQINATTPYDTLRDFAPISLVATAPYVLLVHPSVSAKSVKELVALAKAQPGKLNFASGGAGTGIHMAGELFKLAAGVQIVHVPYKGAGPGMTALIAGEVNLMFNGLSSALPHIKSEKLRALAVGGEQRSPLMPDLPTISESGFQFNTSGWYGVLAPRNTPQPIVAKLHASLTRALNAPQVKDRLTEIAVEINASTPEAFARRLREEMATWGRVVRASGLKGIQVN
jgi:tripartite-type tricarboxylate transporter receptor subunit TctC